MKKIIVFGLTLLLMFSVLACSSARSGNLNAPGAAGDYYLTGLEKAETQSGAGSSKDESAEQEVELERKIVRNANLDLEVADVISAYDSLLDWVTARGGYEIERNQQKSNDVVYINAKIKIKPDLLDELLEYAKSLGEAINAQISTEDITESYYDTKTRLASMELALERYYDFLKKAETIEDSLAVQREINQQTTDIESLKGKLKVWDSLLAESVLTIRLRQTDDPIKLKKDIDWTALSFSDMGYLMKNGLISLTNILVGVFQWLAIVLVAASPVWLVLILVFILIRRKRKKKKQLKENKLSSPDQNSKEL